MLWSLKGFQREEKILFVFEPSIQPPFTFGNVILRHVIPADFRRVTVEGRKIRIKRMSDLECINQPYGRWVNVHIFFIRSSYCIRSSKQAEDLESKNGEETTSASCLVDLKGLEPLTFCLQSRRSSQLSYRPIARASVSAKNASVNLSRVFFQSHPNHLLHANGPFPSFYIDEHSLAIRSAYEAAC